MIKLSFFDTIYSYISVSAYPGTFIMQFRSLSDLFDPRGLRTHVDDSKTREIIMGILISIRLSDFYVVYSWKSLHHICYIETDFIWFGHFRTLHFSSGGGCVIDPSPCAYDMDVRLRRGLFLLICINTPVMLDMISCDSGHLQTILTPEEWSHIDDPKYLCNRFGHSWSGCQI